jgi:hypothetical protein
MTAADVLADLRTRGFRFEAVGGRLRVGPACLLTDADRDTIRRHKPALLALAGGDSGDGGHPDPAAAGGGDNLPVVDRAYYALLPNGLAVPRPSGTRLPAEAIYWCYPGADRWTPVPPVVTRATGLARGA